MPPPRRPRRRRRHRPIRRFVLAVVSHPRTTLGITLTLTAACIILALLRLSISTDQNKLFSQDVPFFRDFVEYTKEFPENEGLFVVVQPRDERVPPPPVERWTAAADAIAAGLNAMPKHVQSASARVAPESLGAQGVLFENPARLRATVEDARRFVPLIKLVGERPNTLTALLGATPIERLLSSLATQPPSDETAPFLREVAVSLRKTLEAPAATRPTLPDLAALDADDPSRLGYFYVPDEEHSSRRLLLVRVTPREDYTSLTAISETVEAIRAAVDEAVRPFPEFSAGVTGRPALDADEMRTTDTDSTRAEVVALSAVFVGLVLLLRSFWLAFAAEPALGVGIAWTFGWATLTLGELNLLSIVFMLALIGIGMDYLVQVLSRYRAEAARHTSAKRVWVSVFRQVGPPINTATLGAAGAFLVSLLTDFAGAADLGLIAGGGLILCLLAGYTFLPALLTVWPARVKIPDVPTPVRGTLETPRWVGPVCWLVLLAIGIPFALRTKFDPGLLELQAPHLQSVKLVHKLETWSAVILSKDLNALRVAREAVASLPVIERTESVLDAGDNRAALNRDIPPLPAIEWTDPAPVAADAAPRVARSADTLAGRWTSFPAVAGALRAAAAAARAIPAEAAAARLTAWQAGLIEDFKGMLAAFHPPPPDVAALPPDLRNHLIGRTGVYALHLYPREDLWDRDALERFVDQIHERVRALKTPVTFTGIAPDIRYSTTSIRGSFRYATAYALGLILLLVWIDLRRVGQTLAAVSVLALGLPMLVALMGLFKVNWNFANFFGLPILIGAGHEYGVFLVHRYREAMREPRRRAWVGWDTADRALLLCAFVTSSSFGFFFLLARHRGLKSLGLVMALGSACIYLAGLVVLRPILKWRLERSHAK